MQATGKVSKAPKALTFAPYGGKAHTTVRGFKVNGAAASNPSHATANGTVTLCHVGLQRNAHLQASGWVWRAIAGAPTCRTCAKGASKGLVKPASTPRKVKPVQAPVAPVTAPVAVVVAA